MSELDVLIGQRLQQARKAIGFRSARSFARQHNIPESTYSQHETGKRSLNPTTLVDYCEKLKISPGWLISGQDATVIDAGLLAAVLEKTLVNIVTPNAQAQLKDIAALCVTSYTQIRDIRPSTVMA